MKKNIHPKYYNNSKAVCICGNTFTTGSTLQEIPVDICSACHPFFTGESKFIDIQGRVEKFKNKQKHADTVKKSKKDRKKSSDSSDSQPKTLKEMLNKKD
ncbi:50S ribosomal protein L31 [Candidatus Microgenomates bacterium]|nr:50S ribosomal protein L31 [Candidatus Microgenomates bacterium]